MAHRKNDQIKLYNRRSGGVEIEHVYARRWMDLFYGTPLGRRITAQVLCWPPLSVLYGLWQKHPRSRRQIPDFVSQYRVDVSQAVIPDGGFASFNDFFIRRLKPGMRPIDSDPTHLIAPADSRLQVNTLSPDSRLAVKGMRWRLSQLLGTDAFDDEFNGGLCLCFRLAPCDYHRFGYPDDGIQGPVHTLSGRLHSVNPLAMRHKEDILATNYRQWCLVKSERFGTMIQVEVGAMIVGSIVQRRLQGGHCRRGEEKGYFQFGGSTLLLFLKPDRVVMDTDIRDYSSKGIETLVQYGEAVGRVSQ